MKAKKEQQRVARRDLLKFAGLGSVAGAAALTSAGAGKEAAAAEPTKDSGYRETKHVRTYYDLAKF
jgi:hypothetical protein